MTDTLWAFVFAAAAVAVVTAVFLCAQTHIKKRIFDEVPKNNP